MAALIALVPVLAEADWAEIIKQGGLASVILLLALFLKWLVAGRFRLEREVIAEHEARLEERAGRLAAEDKLSRMQESWLKEFSPALLRNSVTGEKLEESVTAVVKRMETLLDAFLQMIREGRR